MNKELLFFKPVFKDMIWGGNRMKEVFNYDIPTETTGECWAISAHKNGDCVCVSKGHEGFTLSELWKNEPQLFGNYNADVFPLLLKVIDAKTDLSIQVHPDDEYAVEHENGSLGKTECWYVLDCEKDSTLVIGHKAKTKEELCKFIDEGNYNDLITEVPVKKGDFVQINPGTIHAIKGGVMLLETQQNSDITYRVYDYDRLLNGKKRELHVEQSKAVITVPSPAGTVMHTSEAKGCTTLINCEYYCVEKINVENSYSIIDNAPFRIVSCIEGKGSVDGVSITKGSHLMIPCGYGETVFEGKMTLITSIPGKKA